MLSCLGRPAWVMINRRCCSLYLVCCITLSMLSGSLSQSSSCNPNGLLWLQTNQTHSSGGTQLSATTVDNCKTSCISNSSCVALDFNLLDGTCYAYYNLNSLLLQASDPNINQYVLQRCVLSTTAVTTTAATTTAATAASAASTVSCTGPSYTIVNNTHSYFGTQTNLTTAGDCQAYCLAFLPCQALDFNRVDSSCFIYINTSYILYRTPLTGIDQYVLQRCNATTTTTVPSGPSKANTLGITACTQFYAIPDVHSFGATKVAPTTVRGCQTYCVGSTNPSCVAIDFNNNENSCWVYTDPSQLNVRHQQVNITQYVLQSVLQPCTPDTTVTFVTSTPGIPVTTTPITSSSTTNTPSCQPTFTAFNNTHAFNGNLAFVSTLGDCQAVCTITPACLSIDFNTYDSSCYYFTNANPPIGTQPFVTHYIINRTCDNSQAGVSGTSTTISTATSSSASTTTTPTTTVITGITSPTTRSTGSPTTINTASTTRITGLTTASTTTSNASTTTAANASNATAATPNTSTATTASTPSTTTATSSNTTTAAGSNTSCIPGQPNFTLYPNQSGTQGTQYPSYNTLQLCQTFCVQTFSCVGINYYYTANVCIVYTNANSIANPSALSGTNLYIINRSGICSRRR